MHLKYELHPQFYIAHCNNKDTRREDVKILKIVGLNICFSACFSEMQSSRNSVVSVWVSFRCLIIFVSLELNICILSFHVLC